MTNIKTETYANKPFFTFMIIAFVTAVILFVPAAAFAEGDADGDGFAEGGDAAEVSFEPASNDANNPGPVINVSPPVTPTGGDSITEQGTPEEGTDANDDTETNTGLINGNQDPAPQPETATEEESNENEEADAAGTNEGGLPDAGGEGNSYKAELTLDGLVEGTGGEYKEFTITFTELSTTGQKLGSAQVELPTGFNPDTDSLVVNSSVDGGDNGWDGKIEGMFIYLWALNEASLLSQNQFVSATYASTTPTAIDTYTFETKAWTGANAGYDGIANDPGKVNNMHADYSDPEVLLHYWEADGSDHYYSYDSLDGLNVDISFEGTGFDLSVLIIDRSATSILRFDNPAEHLHKTTKYTPTDLSDWTEEVIGDDEWRHLEAIFGYYSEWSDFYHMVSSPTTINPPYKTLMDLMKAQPQFFGISLDGKSEAELKTLAHAESLEYYRSEVKPTTDQVWLAQVSLTPEATGGLAQFIMGAYGRTDQAFSPYGGLWNYYDGYEGLSDGFGFVAEQDDPSDYRVVVGDLYPGNYIIVEQEAIVSNGLDKGYKFHRDLSSAYRWGQISETVRETGTSDIMVNYLMTNLPAGPDVPVRWWDLFPNDDDNSNTYDPALPPISFTIGSTQQTKQTISVLQKVIKSGFVTNGTHGQLIAAKLSHSRALQMYQLHGATLTPTEKAAAETTLAVAWAAIQALEVSLKARAGEQFDLGMLLEAYSQARAVLAASRDLLTPELIAYANAILAEISALISSLTPQTS